MHKYKQIKQIKRKEVIYKRLAVHFINNFFLYFFAPFVLFFKIISHFKKKAITQKAIIQKINFSSIF
jgi:hypothetical protein